MIRHILKTHIRSCLNIEYYYILNYVFACFGDVTDISLAFHLRIRDNDTYIALALCWKQVVGCIRRFVSLVQTLLRRRTATHLPRDRIMFTKQDSMTVGPTRMTGMVETTVFKRSKKPHSINILLIERTIRRCKMNQVSMTKH